MGRPLETEKRRELARRAVAVFETEGVAVSMTRIAEELGIKRPTLLYHFPTRGHIAETALEDLLREQAMFVIGKIAEHEHPIDQIYARVCAVHEFHHTREARVMLLTQAIATSGATRLAEIIDVGNRVFEPYRQAQATQLRAGIAAGIVAPCDPDAVLALVRAVIDGLMVQRVMTGVELAPIHESLWTHVLRPLKLSPTD